MVNKNVGRFALIAISLVTLKLNLLVGAPSVTLRWDPNSESNLAGYRLYYGRASRGYTQTIPLGRTDTTVTISNLLSGRYFFAVTAFNTWGVESPLSSEVSYLVPDSLQNVTPQAVSLSLLMLEDQLRSVFLSAYDSDGDELEFILRSTPVHGTLSGIPPKLVYQPHANFTGLDAFTYVVSDGKTTSQIATVTFSVTAVNDTPTLNPLPDVTIDANSATQTILLSGISGGSVSEEQPLIVSAVSSNPGLIPTPLITYTSPGNTGTLSFRPVPNASGTATIIARVWDGQSQNGMVNRSFVVTVRPPNGRPIVQAGPDQSVAVPHGITLAGSVTDDGLPNPPALAVTWRQMSGPGVVTFDDAQLTNSAAFFSEPGIYVLRLSATDGALWAGDDVQIEVLPAREPVISNFQVAAMDARTLVAQWQTDTPSFCWIDYGPDSDLGYVAAGRQAYVTNHVLTVTNLLPDTDYILRLWAVDQEGEYSVTDFLPVATPPVAILAWSAEAGALASPMTSMAQERALDGRCIWSPAHGQGAASYKVVIPEASLYRVWCRVWAPDTESGSFNISLDGERARPLQTAGAGWTNNWRWLAVSDPSSPSGAWECNLAAGLHAFEFSTYRAGTLFDEFILSNDPEWAPGPPLPSPIVAAYPVSSSRNDLKWTPLSGNDGFRVEYSTNGLQFLPLATVPAGSTSLSHWNLDPDLSYGYRIQAFNELDRSDYSNVAITQTPLHPRMPTPTEVEVLADWGQVQITWQDNSPDESLFLLERSSDGVNFSIIQALSANITSALDTPPTSGWYHYRVLSFKHPALSHPSGTRTVFHRTTSN